MGDGSRIYAKAGAKLANAEANVFFTFETMLLAVVIFHSRINETALGARLEGQIDKEPRRNHVGPIFIMLAEFKRFVQVCRVP